MRALGAVLLVGLAGEGVGREQPTDASIHTRAVSDAEAQGVVGGAEAEIVWPPNDNNYQSYDNLRFKVELSNGGPNAQVEIRANAVGHGGTGGQTIQLDGNGDGLFHRRTFWPMGQGQKFDLVMQYKLSGTWYDCTGPEPSHDDQYLHWNVKVHRVEVHNTSTSAYTTNWSASDLDQLMDRSDTAIPNENSNTIDGIYGQCGALQSSVTEKIQWRKWARDTISIPLQCSDLSLELAGCSTDCAVVGCLAAEGCVDDMMAAAGQTGSNYAHIYVINRIGCTTSEGIIMGAQNDVLDGKRFVLIEDDFDPSVEPEISTMLVAHELGHAKGEPHTDLGSDNCDEDTYTNAGVKNLMCNSIGRLLEDDQCDRMRMNGTFNDYN